MSNAPFVPPFAGGPVTAPETPSVEGVEKKARKKGGERKTPNAPMSKEDIQFVVKNVKTMSYKEIADARNLTKHQVNRALMEAKKMLRDGAGEDEAKKAKVEAYIKDYLSRPEDTLPGAGGRKSEVKAAINDVVGDILSSL
jgi:hypothetical protein